MPKAKLSAEEITEKLSEVNNWDKRDEKIYRRFNFENFAEALEFVNKSGAVAEKLDHHPDITFGWGYAEFEITTHDAGGLTEKDFELARKIEEL